MYVDNILLLLLETHKVLVLNDLQTKDLLT